jgi:hypothetical protein
VSVRTASPLLQLISDLLELLFLVKVRGDEVCFALAQRIQLFACLFAGFGVARGDVDRGTVLDEAFGDHATNSLCAASDEDDFVLSCLVSMFVGRRLKQFSDATSLP